MKTVVSLRVADKTLSQLDYIVNVLGGNRSENIIHCIEVVYNSLNKDSTKQVRNLYNQFNEKLNELALLNEQLSENLMNQSRNEQTKLI